MSLNADTYLTTRELLEYLRKSEDDFQIPFFRIYNPGAGATVQVTETTLVLVTTAGGTDTFTLADAANDTVGELITAIEALAEGWVINRLCRTTQPSTNLSVMPATACVAIANELTLTGFDELYLESVINRATDAVDTYLRRKILTTVYTDEFYDGEGQSELMLKQFPITTLTVVAYYDKYLAAVVQTLTEDTDFIQYADEGYLYKGTGWANGHKNIRITYTGGYASADIPSDIKEAALSVCEYAIDTKGNTGIKSEKIGDYSVAYTGENAQSDVSAFYVPKSLQGLLNPHRRLDR